VDFACVFGFDFVFDLVEVLVLGLGFLPVWVFDFVDVLVLGLVFAKPFLSRPRWDDFISLSPFAQESFPTARLGLPLITSI
jgi:hypothetical protein